MTTSTALSRRELFRRLGITGAAAAMLPGLSHVLAFQQGARRNDTVPQGVLNATEAGTLAAICARLIPSDDAGPGATEARASTYIDRALGGWLAPSRPVYTEGLAAQESAARSTYAAPFCQSLCRAAGRVTEDDRRNAVFRARPHAHHSRHVL